jgi:predicted small secreted protein
MKKPTIFCLLAFSALLFGCSTPQKNGQDKSSTTVIEVSGKIYNSKRLEPEKVKGTLTNRDGSSSVMILNSTNSTGNVVMDTPEAIQFNGQIYKVEK